MSSSEEPDTSKQDVAEAYREIAKGEQTAAALEANLTNLESKLDAILAALEEQEQQQQQQDTSNKKDSKEKDSLSEKPENGDASTTQ